MNKNTWAYKLSAASQDDPPSQPPASSQPPAAPKFSWANLSSSSQTSSSRTSISDNVPEAETSLVNGDTSHHPETSDQCVDNDNTETQPTNNTEDIPETVEKEASDSVVSVETKEVVKTKEVVEEASTDLSDNGNLPVIQDSDAGDLSKPDPNGNFTTDDNKNITNIKCFAHEEAHDKITESSGEPLTNGDIAIDEEKEENKEEAEDEDNVACKDDQLPPVNADGKKQYDRDFLISLKTNPLSLQKPDTLPTNMEVILNSPNMDTIRNVTSAPNLKMFDHPAIRSSASHTRGTPR